MVIGTRSTSSDEKPIPFDVNKRFIFTILDRARNILLFFGQLVNGQFTLYEVASLN